MFDLCDIQPPQPPQSPVPSPPPIPPPSAPPPNPPDFPPPPPDPQIYSKFGFDADLSLFDGTECYGGFDLSVEGEIEYINVFDGEFDGEYLKSLVDIDAGNASAVVEHSGGWSPTCGQLAGAFETPRFKGSLRFGVAEQGADPHFALAVST